jgi:uncharacterized protein YecE (DUF72 family)
MVLIGTAGFSYADWQGRFYPPALPARDRLGFYARTFQVVEVDSTYYRLPQPGTMAAMTAKAGNRLTFVVKTHQSMTHARNATEADYAAFRQGIEPMASAGVLGGVLAQFPFAFVNHQAHRDYLIELKARLGLSVPLITEFRHRTWNVPEAYAWLRKLELCFVNVDEPDLKGLLPPTNEATGPVGYVRFHGRNREKWFKRGAEPWERYDYLYKISELEPWVPRIQYLASHAQHTFVIFNNHWQSQAVTNARQMAELLGQPLPEPEVPQAPGKRRISGPGPMSGELFPER